MVTYAGKIVRGTDITHRKSSVLWEIDEGEEISRTLHSLEREMKGLSLNGNHNTGHYLYKVYSVPGTVLKQTLCAH